MYKTKPLVQISFCSLSLVSLHEML